MDNQYINELVSKDQFIKLVPSLEDSLRQIGLDVDLDENSELWLQKLFITWKSWKKSSTVEKHIRMFLQSRPDSYRVALIFVIKSPDFKDCKPKTLPYCIIETLQKWAQTSNIVPEEPLKLPAFHIAIKQRNQQFLNLIVRTYHIFTIKEIILPIVKDYLRNDNCKQATQIVTAMELFDEVPVQDLLFPLVLQDRPHMIDEYLSQCPKLVEPFLLFLDTLIDKSFNIRDYVQNYADENKICNIKYEKLHYKPLGKLVARLCNKFKIPIEMCKNLSKNRTTSGLRYLIYQKYLEHNLSDAVWDDLVKDSLVQNADCAEEFINTLLTYDKKEAHKWAEYLKMPESCLPLALKEQPVQDKTHQDKETAEDTENWDLELNESQEYYKLSLSDDKVHLIDTGEKFYEFICTVSTKYNIVSVDCEWKPSFLTGQCHVALIQIATKNCVYLIDTLILNNEKYANCWHTFNKSFFDNAEIIKLGFGIEVDLKEIKNSVIGLSNIKVKGEGLLDLHVLWKTLINNGIILPGDCSGNSLSSLVKSCFGLPLAKSEQCSNWELRPLRKTQTLYAALDAFVLLELYDFLKKKCIEQGINFDEICNDVMLDRKNKCSKKVNVPDKIQTGVPPVKACDVKFLVDPVLSNLMSYLRYCGIDTTVMKTTMLWVDVINLAISEDRYIVLAKLKFSPTVDYPQSSIITVGRASIKDQLQRILSNYNITVRLSDLFTRCIRCNEIDLKKLSPNEVHDICNKYESSSSSYESNTKYVCDYENEESDYNNFLSDSDCDEFGQPIDVVKYKQCKTAKGVPIEIHNVKRLSSSNNPAVLCESCGKLYWTEDTLLRPVEDMVLRLTKLKI